MTTSSSSGAASLEALDKANVSAPAEERSLRLPHTLASRFLFLTLCIALVLSALAYGTVHYWALALFTLGALQVVVLWALDGWRLGTLRLSRNPLQWPLLGMVVLGLIQLLPLSAPPATGLPSVTPARALSLDPYSTRLVIVQVATLFIYFAATLVFTDSPHRLRLLVRTITIFGFLLAMFGLTQSFTSPTKVYWIRELEQSTAFGPFINRHHFAGYMELTIALPLGLLFSGSVEREKVVIYAFAAALMGVALVMTQSRGGIIALAAEILFLLAVAGIRRRRRSKHSEGKERRARLALGRVALAFALLLGVFGGVLFFGGEAAITRFVGSVDSGDPTTGRAHFWRVTLNIISAHPVVGTGLGAFGVVYTRYDTRNGLFRLEQAHNDYLQVLSDGGVVGAALGLVFVLLLFRIGLRRRETSDKFRKGVATGALAGCFAVLVHSFFDFTLHTSANALLFLVLAALATLNGRVKQHHHGRRRHRQDSHSGALRAEVEADSGTS